MAIQKALVLLAGATRYLGYLILVALIKSGYGVRIVIRSKAELSKVLVAPSPKTPNPSPERLS